jgi:hypothetical protein
MATVIKTIPVQDSPEVVWDALRDIGAVHTRLAPGFVTATELVPGGRRLTFANGQTIVETIITVDDQHHRLVWSTQGNVTTHYNASAEVTMDEDGGSIVTWTADFLPDSAAAAVDGLMTGVAEAVVRTFDLVEES